MAFIIQDDTCAWYEIGIQEESFWISFHESCLLYIEAYFNPASERTKTIGTTSIPPVIPHTESNWGFGPILKNVDCDRPGWHKVTCCWPNRGTNAFITTADAYPTTATLQALFSALWMNNEPTLCNKLQLFTIDEMLVEERSHHSGSIKAAISCHLCEWLGNQVPESITAPLRDAMVRMYGRLSSEAPNGFMHEIRASIDDTYYLDLVCPGNGAVMCADELSRRRYGDEQLYGYDLQSHNAHGPLQQLVFLAALAKLHDVARANGV